MWAGFLARANHRPYQGLYWPSMHKMAVMIDLRSASFFAAPSEHPSVSATWTSDRSS
jgi:hypothetical protein